jgi:hypothetical protein
MRGSAGTDAVGDAVGKAIRPYSEDLGGGAWIGWRTLGIMHYHRGVPFIHQGMADSGGLFPMNRPMPTVASPMRPPGRPLLLKGLHALGDVRQPQ